LIQLLETIPWLVWLVPIIGALLTPILASINHKIRDYGACLFTLVSAILASLLLPAALKGETIHNQIPWITALNIKAGVLADPLSVIMANVVAWLSFLIMIYSLGYMHGEHNLTRFWFFMNFFIGNMLLIVLSDNFLQLFFGWEGVGLCSYALIGFWHNDEIKNYVGTPGQTTWGLSQAYSPSQAGMKAFIMTKIGDVSFLIGLLILYYYAGTFDFIELGEKTGWGKEIASIGLFVPVAVLIFGGAIGKSAQFPLHEWLPDAMAGPTAVSALIHAATMVKAGVFLVARVGPIFYNAAATAEQISPLFITIASIGILTAFLAATQAAVAKEVKKVLAYSTVSQIGFMMLGLGAAGLSEDFTSGYTASFFHLISHAIFKASLFMCAGALIHSTGTKYLNEMGGLKKYMKYTFISMFIVSASLAGVPFLSGFWSKDAILSATLQMESSLATPFFILAVITALITAFYSFRMIGLVFFGNKSEHLEKREKQGHSIHESSKVMLIPYSILAAVTILIGLVGLLFEESLHSVLSINLEEKFVNIHIVEEASGINSIALLGSLTAVGVGGLVAYYYYISRKGDTNVILKNKLIGGLCRFFENRWYINAIYYKIFVNSTLVLSKSVFRTLELGIIDKISMSIASGSIAFSNLGRKFDSNIIDGVSNGISNISQNLSAVFRKIQTGITEEYVFMYIAGIIVLALLFFYMLIMGIGV